MSTKHTPGPWKFHSKPINGNYTIETDRELRGDCWWVCDTGESAYILDEERKANAARIVACVNACEGIADPSAVKDLLEALEMVAELLALDEKEGVDCYALRARHDIAAAIAKATGTNI